MPKTMLERMLSYNGYTVGSFAERIDVSRPTARRILDDPLRVDIEMLITLSEFMNIDRHKMLDILMCEVDNGFVSKGEVNEW